MQLLVFHIYISRQIPRHMCQEAKHLCMHSLVKFDKLFQNWGTEISLGKCSKCMQPMFDHEKDSYVDFGPLVLSSLDLPPKPSN